MDYYLHKLLSVVPPVDPSAVSSAEQALKFLGDSLSVCRVAV